jgi:EpsI family protein
MGEALPLDREFLWTLKFLRYAHRPYRLEGVKVDVFVGYGDRRNRNWSLLSPKNALPGRGWEVEGRSFVRLDSWDRRVTRVVARSGPQRILTYHWYEGMDSVALEALRAGLAIDQSPLWRSQRPRVIRISTRVGVGALEEAAADQKLRAFAGALAKVLLPGEPRRLAAREQSGSGGYTAVRINPSAIVSFFGKTFSHRGWPPNLSPA